MSTAPTPPAQRTAWPLLFGVVTFVSAFLLFQVQLIIAKYMLPWFGGSAAVWATCVLFFQILLLTGYAYTHGTRKLDGRKRFRVHAALLGGSVLLLAVEGFKWRSPIAPAMNRLYSADAPTLSVLVVLLVSVGLPFWLLSTTSPLIQDWFWRIEHRSPYRLYAISNLGSLLGLLTYPFLFEPTLSVIRQGWLWFGGFVVFSGGVLACGARASREPAPEAKPRRKKAAVAVDSGQAFWWVLLAAAGSACMLATTNYLTQDIASVPLLWVLPLSIYLISFVLTFESDRLYRREIVLPLLFVSLAGVYFVLARSGLVRVMIELPIVNAALLFATVVCHGELARLKPAPESLTRFYVWVAFGGALGSSLVGLVAPHVFSGVWEFQICLVLVAILAALMPLRDRTSWIHTHPSWKVAGATTLFGVLPLALVYILLPLLPQVDETSTDIRWVAWTLLAVSVISSAWMLWKARHDDASFGRPWSFTMAFLVPAFLVVQFWTLPQLFGQQLVLRTRNFYGVLSVTKVFLGNEFGDFYTLYNGRVLHGRQALKPELQTRPTSYYGNYSGVGLSLLDHPRRKMSGIRVGVVGMGVGTVMAYAERGDFFHVYELNPDVAALSNGPKPFFTYLRDCLGKCEVSVGDGRLLLQNEADSGDFQKFDVLVLDAFSGDAIPVHLLTREAFELYLRHLRDPDSVIAVHVSNNVLNLRPIVGRIAHELGLHAISVDSPRRGEVILPSVWIIVSRNPHPLILPADALRLDDISELGPAGPLWTDDFSNLLSVIRR